MSSVPHAHFYHQAIFYLLQVSQAHQELYRTSFSLFLQPFRTFQSFHLTNRSSFHNHLPI